MLDRGSLPSTGDVKAVDRMSPQDASFLYIEDANNPMHVGSVVVFEGPPPTYGDMVRMVASKLHLVPRYRQKVRFPPLELGRPVWVDDPHFQILYHVRNTAVPPPGGDEELRNLAGRVFAQLLDRTKPLWELWLVQGLPEGRWALVQKVHHCLVDGIAGTDLMSIMFEASPDARLPAPVAWTARREPSTVELAADALTDGVSAPLTYLRSLPLAARAPFLNPEETFGLVRGLVRRPSLTLRRGPSGLNGPVGPHRRWSWVKTSLDEVRFIKGALGGSVNDVVLTAITKGFRELLLERGEPVENRYVRTLVPVSVRAATERGTLNNRVSGVFPELPVGVEDPLQRLELIREQMDGLKESRQAVAGDALIRLSGFTPPMWLSLGARLGARLPQRLVHTVTTNVPGPRQPLYAGGRRMLECYPYVPIGGQVRVGIAIFSYVDGLTFGLTGDYDTMPDLDTLGAGILEGMAELRRLAEERGSKVDPRARSVRSAARPRRAAARRPPATR
jgi:diacylglycerol O-acyltransferase